MASNIMFLRSLTMLQMSLLTLTPVKWFLHKLSVALCRHELWTIANILIGHRVTVADCMEHGPVARVDW